MRRRKFLALLSLLPTAPHLAFAQKRTLIAILVSGSQEGFAVHIDAFRRRLQQLGYSEGRDVDIAYRYAHGDIPSLAGHAEELVRLAPKVIVTTSTAATLAVKRLTSDIPIVAAILTDPIGQGLVSSLNRPRSNVTGILVTIDGLAEKHVELAREVLPDVQRIAVLVDVENPSNVFQRRKVESAIRSVGAEAVPVEIRKPAEINAAFELLARERVRAVIVLASALFINARSQIATLAKTAGVASIYANLQDIKAGGLISYGVDDAANHERAADFADKILKSTKPVELPVEFPPRISLVINLGTAKALGLSLPASLLARADDIVE